MQRKIYQLWKIYHSRNSLFFSTAVLPCLKQIESEYFGKINYVYLELSLLYNNQKGTLCSNLLYQKMLLSYEKAFHILFNTAEIRLKFISALHMCQTPFLDNHIAVVKVVTDLIWFFFIYFYLHLRFCYVRLVHAQHLLQFNMHSGS